MSTDEGSYAWIRRGSYLTPSNVMSEDILTGIKEGQEVLISVRKARNPQHLRKLFALLKITPENTDHYVTTTDLLEDLKVAVGHATTCHNIFTGEVSRKGKSISFAAMSQKDFEFFYKAAISKCSELIGTDIETLAEQVWSLAEKRSGYGKS
mgnify:CR=1 FL=1